MKRKTPIWTLFLLLGIVACGPEQQEPETIDQSPSLPTEKTSFSSEPSAASPVRQLIPFEELTPLKWEDLTDVEFKDKYYEDIEAWLLFPTFGDSVKALEGKPVYISGYVLTLMPGRYALSANPFSSCFFCGGAGPESVMALSLQDTTAVYYTDEWHTFQGTLRLNDSDVDQLNYVLEGAVVQDN